MSTEDTIVVFTARSPDRIVREGGSQAWVLNPNRARQCQYLVCTQNQHNRDHAFSDATERHGSAFLVGRISEIRQADGDGDDEERWMIAISDYALVDVPDVWGGARNPVRYASLESLGISVGELDFIPMKEAATPPVRETATSTTEIDIDEMKRLLAAHFRVAPGAIEISVRV